MFNDELINPFPSDANEFLFISAENYASFDSVIGKNKDFRFQIRAFLSGELYVENRAVYNFWNLLGDVGGFHDGLVLVASLFMGFISQMSFEKNYLHDKKLDKFDSEKSKDFQNTNKFKLFFASI